MSRSAENGTWIGRTVRCVLNVVAWPAVPRIVLMTAGGFVGLSAMSAWASQPFDFPQTIRVSAVLAIITEIVLNLEISPAYWKRVIELRRKRAALRRKWAETMGDVERLRSVGSVTNGPQEEETF